MEGVALAALINGLIDLVTRLIVSYASHPQADPAALTEMQGRLDATAALVASKKPIPPPTA